MVQCLLARVKTCESQCYDNKVAFASFFLCLFHLHYSKECVYKSTIHIVKIGRKVQRTSHYVGKTSLILCRQKIKCWTML